MSTSPHEMLSLMVLDGVYVIDAPNVREIELPSRVLPKLRSGLMISTDKPVRIIERKQRELLSVEGKVVPLAKSARQIEREMAQKVASWIDERREGVKEFARSNGAGGLLRLSINLEGGRLMSRFGWEDKKTMKLRIALMLFSAFVLVSATRVSAQDTGTAAQTVENLRAQLSEVQDREAEVKIRLEQLDFDLKPENIERYFNAVGSTRPEELRESRRRQLQTEKDRLVAQLEQLASSRGRLETAITSAQVKAYQQSAVGAAALQIDKNGNLLTFGRVLLGIVVLLVVIGSLVLRLVIRRRRNV